ncbi:ABC-three component system middle component 1 [Azotobacter salinestris]|uniref:ABC-three component system middle component 1 n=1 Tax=Azotobacter salinestris TaxID=69964 RepID=UPI0032DE54C7
MITELINQGLAAQGFTKAHENDITGFYFRESGSAIRFAILHKLNELLKPGDLNAVINQSAPEAFLSDPAFRKNCDLICIHHLDKLAEFKNHEDQIFEIEEDPHFYKKYVLYYSDAEAEALRGLSFDDLKEIISDKTKFNAYKEDPLAATQYSAAAKIFIKLPFLELQSNKIDLVPLRLQIDEAVAEADLVKVYESVQRFGSTNIDDLIKEIINDELANLQD